MKFECPRVTHKNERLGWYFWCNSRWFLSPWTRYTHRSFPPSSSPSASSLYFFLFTKTATLTALSLHHHRYQHRHCLFFFSQKPLHFPTHSFIFHLHFSKFRATSKFRAPSHHHIFFTSSIYKQSMIFNFLTLSLSLSLFFSLRV